MLRGVMGARLVALFFAGMAVLNFPLLMLWNRQDTLFGLPLLPAGLFFNWALLLVALVWVMESRED